MFSWPSRFGQQIKDNPGFNRTGYFVLKKAGKLVRGIVAENHIPLNGPYNRFWRA
jgi:hypothetical protein